MFYRVSCKSLITVKTASFVIPFRQPKVTTCSPGDKIGKFLIIEKTANGKPVRPKGNLPIYI